MSYFENKIPLHLKIFNICQPLFLCMISLLKERIFILQPKNFECSS